MPPMKRSRSRSRDPPAPPANRRQLPWPTTGRSPSLPKAGFLAARRTGMLRGRAVPRPRTPPRSQETSFRRSSSSPSPEPADADEPASPTERCRDVDGGRKRKKKKALYLVTEEHGQGHERGVVSTYAVHRVADLARSQHGISVVSGGEEFEEDPPVLRFKAAPGMAFFLKSAARSSMVVVGVTDRSAGAVEAESVIIDASNWEVSAGPPPPSTGCGVVEVSGRIFAADMLAEDPRCAVLRSAAAAAAARDDGFAGHWSWSSLPRPPFRDRIVALAAYPPRRGLLASTEKGETFLLDGRRGSGEGAAWVALLPGSAGAARLLPDLGDRAAVYAKDHGLWFEVSPDDDGRLRAHQLDVVLGCSSGPRLEHETHRVADPIPVVITASSRARGGGATRSRSATKLVYLGRSMFCVVQAQAGGVGVADGGCPVTVTVFRVIDSQMPVTLAERRRRRRRRLERGMNARWVADELERACRNKTSASSRRRKLCRVNLWSRTYIVRGGADDRCRSLPVAGVLWM